MNNNLKKFIDFIKKDITPKKIIIIIIWAMILTFGIHNIHQRTDITEGGIIGLTLLIEHWFNISPAYITFVLDGLCYLWAYKIIGKDFLKISAIPTLFISIFYKVWEAFPYMLPDFSQKPLIASILGGMFVGVGVGLTVRQGGSSGGDDALALSINHLTKWRISRCYLFTDITVLLLSLSYIPITKIIYSLITVTISSLLIDFIKEY